MDFEKLNADVNMFLTKHYTKGRGGKNVEFVGIHYNAGDLTVEGCYSVWQTREASAHYQVESSGRCGQLVHDWDTAWALGNFDANQRSINIEHANKKDGTITEECLDVGAHLTAAICKRFGLGRPEWGKNVKPHSSIKPTQCPGQIYGSQKDAYIQRAQYWYDKMMGGEPVAPTPTPDPEPSIPQIDVDGLWGTDTTLRIQQVLEAPYKDGKMSRQNKHWKSSVPGCTLGWEWMSKGYGNGSQTIKLIQKKIGVKADGLLGKDTINGLIKYFMQFGSGATKLDGKLDRHSKTIKCMQRRLNEGKF